MIAAQCDAPYSARPIERFVLNVDGFRLKLEERK
jgi:hypothetical protein